ncbi:hypothetical protein ASF08_21245 [Methylobacterium sp. Leaf85]|nr:hypothetical protein ASF08_21245 [Methylobacterium sp. Leaf85]
MSNGAGGYTVTPAADYNGPLVISYDVGDGTTSIPATLSTTLAAVNDAPRLTGTQATLAAGTEDTAFTVTAAELLQGFADPEGTALVLSGLSVDHGTIVSDGEGGYTVTPAADYNGPLVISYSVGDGATSIPATLSTTLEAVNDAPRLTGTQATLAAGTEDTAFTVSAAELLQGFADPPAPRRPWRPVRRTPPSRSRRPSCSRASPIPRAPPSSSPASASITARS